jgi:putative nucleotidyltransferase with HDIG domain
MTTSPIVPAGPADLTATTEAPTPVRARRDWAGRALSVALVTAVALASGWLLAPADAERLPGADALGQPAATTIKADRDYDIEDPEATARRRAEAAASAEPVYDFDQGAADEAGARMHAAFQLMRDEEQAYRVLAGRGRASLDEPKALPDGAKEALVPAELRRRYAAQRDAFATRLQVLIRDDDFAALAEVRFSEALERELAFLVCGHVIGEFQPPQGAEHPMRGLAGRLVEDVKLLATNRAQGLVMRTFSSGELVGERVLAGEAPLQDLAEAREEMARLGAARLAGEKPAVRTAVIRLAGAMLHPTLVYDQSETVRRRDDAAARVKPVVVAVKRGERIIADGERIERRHLLLFEGMRAQRNGEDVTHVRLGGGALVALLVSVLWIFGRRNVPRFRPARRDALLLTSLLVATLALSSLGLTVADALHERFPVGAPASALRYLVPVAAGAMIVRQVLSAEAALLFALAAGLAGGLLAGQSIGYAVFATLTSMAAAGFAQGSRDRAGFFRTGLLVGLAGAAAVAALGLFGGRPPGELLATALTAFLGGAIALPVAVVGFLPVVEGVFGYVTDVKLLELANLNHPALKELIVQAPGTYHHSILMGAMVEAGAQAIGANPLLARVCAYYHDLGKTRNPLYFAENQRGDNKHDALAPSMSALIVKRHVTDGLELARRWRLPQPVRDAIAEHHGSRHAGYFWAKAQRAAQDGAARGGLDESLFRYPGPRPRTREAALVMIADACEASARALEAPGAEALRTLVGKRINEIFAEGQLDECELTLRDLNAIAGAMVRALEAIYHTRPEYPRAPAPPDAPAVQLVTKG